MTMMTPYGVIGWERARYKIAYSIRTQRAVDTASKQYWGNKCLELLVRLALERCEWLLLVLAAGNVVCAKQHAKDI